jgi:hypothetical protein
MDRDALRKKSLLTRIGFLPLMESPILGTRQRLSGDITLVLIQATITSSCSSRGSSARCAQADPRINP